MSRAPRFRAERVFRCVGCGLPRLYLNRPCHTCERLARRYQLRGQS